MIELKVPTGDRSGPAVTISWTDPAWDRLTAGEEEPRRLLRGLTAIAFERYGAGTAVHGGAAAVALLTADDGTRRWPDLLATLAEPVAAPTGEPFVVVVGDSDGADLALNPGPGHIDVTLRPEVFSAETAEQILHHLRRLAEQLLRDPGARLADLDPLTPEEHAVNGGAPLHLPTYPPVTLHQLASMQAWRTPEAEAIRHGSVGLTYRHLDDAANVLAHRIVAVVPPGAVVAVAGERCLGLFTALLATLKAGGVFLYLDPAMPPARLAEFLRIGGAQLVLRGPGAVVPDSPLPVIDFPARPNDHAGVPCPPPDVVVGPEDPAYILFTSGSTGVPKGVLRSHRLHTSTILLQAALYGCGPADRHLLKLPVSAREVFLALATGGTAVVADQGGERDDSYLVDLIRAERISVVSFVPSMLRILAARSDFAECADLRQIFVGGEALPPDLETRLRGMGYGVDNAYVLTEADHVASRGEPVPDGGDSSVLGTPRNARVYVCDERGRRVPPGIVGEMLVGGVGLASGYVGDAVRTAERFVANPFGDPQAPILFRTGDLARHRRDGMLEYHGRRDLQIKVRGQRVEPTEVEHQLRGFPGLRDVAVVGYPDPEQGGVIVAFVVPDEVTDAGPDEARMREFLAQRLPRYMVPRHFIRLARLPQLVNGKVDRQALRSPAARRPPHLDPPAAPVTATQRRLRDLWLRVLQPDAVGIDDEFVALGGDSLRLLVLRSAIELEFATAVDLTALVSAATVRAQGDLLDGDGRPTPVTIARDASRDRAGADRTGAERTGVERIAAERARRAALRGIRPGAL